MKNLTLMAAVAALTLPVAAQAATSADQREHQWFDGQTSITYNVQNDGLYQDSPFVPDEGQTMTLSLVDGGHLFLDGEAAYIIDEHGNKFLANDAPHMTTAGIAYQTEDGLVLYAIPEMDTYTFTADVKDVDNDGYADDVDFSITEQN